MKKILLTTFATVSLFSNETQLQKQIQQLQKELQQLKATQKELQNEHEELYSIAEKAEANSYADKLKFGIGFKVYVDSFKKKYSNNKTIRNNNVLSMKVMLNAYANITQYMKFHGRFSMYKYWGSAYIHPYSSYDNMQARVPADSGLYVERAYLDWFMFQDTMVPVALTIGRQPSGDGPSHQFKDNVTRKATYSALLYDGASDGAVLTFNLSKLLQYNQTYLRFGYAKGFGYTQTGLASNAYVGASNNDLKDTNVFGVFLDTTLPNVESSLVQISYSTVQDIIANPLDTNTTQNKNIGDVSLFGAMIEVENIHNTNLDLFFHYAHSVAHPNAKGYIVEKNNQTTDFGGLLSQTGDSAKKSGDAIWVGGRYGFGEKQKYKIGIEYNHGSKYWISLTQGAFDVYNKLATRGDVYEFYLMYVINRFANIRLGYIDIDYKYSGSGWFVGKPLAIEDVPTNRNELDRLESIYLKMNVNF